MITDAERAAIDEHVRRLDVDRWRGLDSTERDLLRRALAPPPASSDSDDAA